MPKYKLIHLRNQHKIKAVLGDEKLNRIKLSIQTFMDSNKELEPQGIEGSKYDVIVINDSSNKGMISFYIIDSKFNIYTVAFKEFI